MKSRGRREWGVAAAIVVSAAVLASALLAPAPAAATDSDLKHSAVLKVKASNGYSILVIANSERADGRGQVGLIVYGKGGSATYGAAATITATRFEADLGPLGRISLEVTPSGQKKTLRSRCEGEAESFAYEPLLYSGVFEFHGEEGYADVSTPAPREYARFVFWVLCGSSTSGESTGSAASGARLRLHARSGSFGLNLQANKNRPGARTRFEVDTREKRRGISISRSRTLWVGAGAFTYDPLLRTATLAPPAPFSGRAGFRRGAIAANRWTGDLTVDLPGRSDVPLAGAGIGATLVPGCWQQGGGSFSC
jgi:hypothetical protein